MSTPKRSSGKIRIRIVANEDTETFVIDTRNELKTRGVGTFTTSQRPGRYKFKFRTGTNIAVMKRIPISRTATKTIRAPRLEFSSPAALVFTAKTHEYHRDNAKLTSNQVHMQLGTGSQLFLFARVWTGSWSTAGAGSQEGHDPTIGLTLHSLSGNLLADLAQAGSRQLISNYPPPNSFDPWAACNIALDPGAYRLRLRTLDWGAIDRIVVASPGWQTQVFLLQTPSIDDSPPFSSPVDLANAALLLAPIGVGFNPESPELRLCEIARGALEDDRCTLAQSLLKRSFEDNNPMLGIYCASVLLRANIPDRRLLLKILKRLRHLLPSHPDVEAMALALNDHPAGDPKFSFATPPMLRSSWSLLIKQTIEKPDLIPYGSLSQRVSTNLCGDGVWLTWLGDKVDTMQQKGTANSFNATIGATWDAVRRLDLDMNYLYPKILLAGNLTLNNYEEALLIYLVRGQATQDVLVRALGIPPAAIQATAESLMMKLGWHNPDPLGSVSTPSPTPPL